MLISALPLTARDPPAALRRPSARSRLAAWLTLMLAVTAVVGACGGNGASLGPNPSLATLDLTPLPTLALPSLPPTHTPGPSVAAPSWPVGWDVTFCAAYNDLTVAHELVIDIERAMADDSGGDAAGLATELAHNAPIAAGEIGRIKSWPPAADVTSTMTTLIDLDTQVATAYQTYFNDGGKTALRAARQLRAKVAKAVPTANAQLQALVDLGLTCSGNDLRLETF